jgi:hypothetical protein
MDTHGHGGPVEVHESHGGAGDEPVAVVAVGVLLVLGIGICILWWYASTH